ncbi:hypothetical protein OF83DRAFT_1113528 [Amylostereum chailletii]|nr:hypothetical protein OF83DRAFT_1113528 [Amylostereum chailletii]
MSDDPDPKGKKAAKPTVSDASRTPSAFRRDLEADSDVEQEEAEVDIPSPRWYDGQSPIRSALGLRGQLYGLSAPVGPSPTGSTLALPYGTSRNNSVETFTTVNSDDARQGGYDSDQSMLEDTR